MTSTVVHLQTHHLEGLTVGAHATPHSKVV